MFMAAIAQRTIYGHPVYMSGKRGVFVHGIHVPPLCYIQCLDRGQGFIYDNIFMS